MNRSNMLGFELKVEESMITWKIEVSYLIIDRTPAEIFPVVESLKMSQKNFIKKTLNFIIIKFLWGLNGDTLFEVEKVFSSLVLLISKVKPQSQLITKSLCFR